MDTDVVLDGNVLAGVFGELFQHEMTIARGMCGGCGRSGPLAETRVYPEAPGAVARCPGCDAVLFTIVKDGNRYWMGFDRLRCLEIRAGD